MLLWLLERLTVGSAPAACGEWAALGKITFRAALAAMISFALAVLLGPRMIAWLRRRFREPIKSDSPEIRRLHQDKHATPTMGGLFIVAGLMAGVLVFGDLANPYVLLSLLVVTGLAVLGAVDDLVKLRSAANGISARSKLVGQIAVAVVVGVLLYQQQSALPDGGQLRLPLLGIGVALGWWFVPLTVIVIVGTSNAVNLTDGLDGLAGGCLIFATAAMTALVYAAGHAELAEYLHVPRIPGAGEMTIVAAAMGGAVLGFLWFNCHPAQVFMGDTGALPLGGLLGLLAMVARQELLLILVGGVFVAEAASVLLQVGYYRWRHRRIFLCAPLHHHFQLKGWPENKIVVRFWIASALCALMAMACLKLSAHDEPTVKPAAITAADAPLRR
jgi:phospho-N-acetylmuramoyl-pentapeptide-transferase